MFAGFLFAFVAAAAFGLVAPLVQRVGHGRGPFATSALLYCGAALAALAIRKPARAEAQLHKQAIPRLVLIAVAGAVLAPSALAWGLQHTNGARAGLMLCAEAPFTVLLAVVVRGEHFGRRARVALALLSLGAVVLVVQQASGPARGSAIGLLAVLAATAGWAVDNTLTAPLASHDPSTVVLAKAFLGALLSAALALVADDAWPTREHLILLAACGATGFGASLQLYLRAQRRIGVARTASIFAAAPLLAAAGAVAMGQPLGLGAALAAIPIGIGLYLHATELHEHGHAHQAVEHEHAHRHDDLHHTHHHDSPPTEPHSHLHRHEAVAHKHPHQPDEHHLHRH
jgi:drug/metabolite transporter (DMT)-like permease